jgi:hypothetical protein
MEAKPPLRFRKLRIALSVFFGVVALSLTALWVRSYWVLDDIVRTTPTVQQTVCSNKGVLHLVASDPSGGYSLQPKPGTVTWNRYSRQPSDLRSGFYWTWSPKLKAIQSPYWFVILITAAAAAVPWLPWWSNRFSLRTLLIATTLVAIVLGLTIYAIRN